MGFVVGPPSSGPYLIGLLFVFVSQLITVPLCIGAHKFKRSPAVVCALGVVTAVLPFYIQHWFSNILQDRGWTTFGLLTRERTHAHAPSHSHEECRGSWSYHAALRSARLSSHKPAFDALRGKTL